MSAVGKFPPVSSRSKGKGNQGAYSSSACRAVSSWLMVPADLCVSQAVLAAPPHAPEAVAHRGKELGRYAQSKLPERGLRSSCKRRAEKQQSEDPPRGHNKPSTPPKAACLLPDLQRRPLFISPLRDPLHFLPLGLILGIPILGSFLVLTPFS